MLILEVVDPNTEKLLALSQYILGRADDTAASKKINIESFLNLAHSMGVNITDSKLRDMATQPPLSNVIVNVTDNEVVFAGAGQDTQVTDTMTVTQAQDTVEKMAQRAMD